MKHLALIAALALAGCMPTENSQALRAAYATQIEIWNAAGIDPLQLEPRELMLASASCATLTSLSTVTNPDAPEMTDDLAQWCVEVVRALAPAAPVPE